MEDMMNRIILGICPWNASYSVQQIREGFKKLMESGIYELDFFGDMMMGGIACGIGKRILIFNTNENLIHDPISVVDPTHYDARIKIEDTTPVVVAYNNYHYESLHPIDEQDRVETIRLVSSYIENRYNHDYGYTKNDIVYLISPILNITEEKLVEDIFKEQGKDDQPLNKLEDICNQNNIEEIPKQPLKAPNERFSFQIGNMVIEELEDGTLFCGTCKTSCIRILGHLNNNKNCAQNIDMDEFKTKWIKFKANQRTAKYNKKLRDEN